MKKLASLIAFAFLVNVFSFAQCTPDTTQVPQGQFFGPDTLPCVIRTVAYDQVLQFKIPASINVQDIAPIPFPFTLFVDSLVIDSISGFPSGISYNTNPTNGNFKPGNGGCARVFGTTSDPVGNYPLTLYGSISLRGAPVPLVGFDGDTVFRLEELAQFGSNTPFSLSLDVINQGDVCRPAANSIATIKAFDASIKAYPTPASDVLRLDINATERVNGDLTITDAVGRVVYTEKVDWSARTNHSISLNKLTNGFYNLHIGNTEKSISSKFVITK